MATNKIAVVTGANKGLGLEIARQLAQAGVTVYAAARDQAKADATAQTLKEAGDVRPLRLEVTSTKDIEAAVHTLESEAGHLDILVNNAGMSLGSSDDVSLDQLRTVFETNVFAPFAITAAFLPLLKASPEPRIINQSSILGSLTTVSGGGISGAWLNPAYTSSKAALNMLTVVLAQQLKKTKAKVFTVHPGWVQTDMGGQEAPLQVKEGAKTAVDLALGQNDAASGSFQHLGATLPW